MQLFHLFITIITISLVKALEYNFKVYTTINGINYYLNSNGEFIKEDTETRFKLDSENNLILYNSNPLQILVNDPIFSIFQFFPQYTIENEILPWILTDDDSIIYSEALFICEKEAHFNLRRVSLQDCSNFGELIRFDLQLNELDEVVANYVNATESFGTETVTETITETTFVDETGLETETIIIPTESPVVRYTNNSDATSIVTQSVSYFTQTSEILVTITSCDRSNQCSEFIETSTSIANAVTTYSNNDKVIITITSCGEGINCQGSSSSIEQNALTYISDEESAVSPSINSIDPLLINMGSVVNRDFKLLIVILAFVSVLIVL
ncbi:uncharacterized protein KGF55_002268 [Candida pseudojiufengensis]|uniref:uncharacterized protein n=1 Tax=Candida pseudojiufengensis TaxID=497109 RepID=UPI002225691D|nr:uncharacterized protein KGF55_002268 [Candida pseudojiufengensis]KAI5964326.1 hypothetical protein KGF55_002268 [Candida pseudojiufengensis]